jgi:4-hydroxy-3-polyprenylbenzoate decarboxylase
MAYKGLGDFVAAIEARGELRRIKAEVDPELEIAEIADRVMRSNGPALLFERVKGSAYPLLINAMGSEGRMALALGAESLDEKGAELEALLDWAWGQARDPSILAAIGRAVPSALPKIPAFLSLLPRRVARPPCREVVSDAEGFASLPVLKCWPKDGGRFLTLPVVCIRDPETGEQNMGMYRMQVYDDRAAGMHWHVHKDGSRIFAKYARRGERMPVAVSLGSDPAVTYAATAPLPEGLWEMIFAGYLRGKSAQVAKATMSDIDVPADAEFILEGYVDPEERRTEGPFGDHTGFYSLEDEYPVFHLERITRRKSPIYPATIVGIPPKEDCWMARATERLFLPFLKRLCPEIRDLSMPLEGVFHDCVIVSISKRYPGQARKVMNFIWGMGQMMYTKLIVVVDEEVRPSDYSAVARKAFNNVDASRDLVLSEGPLDALDHSSPRPRYGTRMGVDATRKLPEEGHGRPWPDALKMDERITRLVDGRWREYGID